MALKYAFPVIVLHITVFTETSVKDPFSSVVMTNRTENTERFGLEGAAEKTDFSIDVILEINNDLHEHVDKMLIIHF